MTYEGNECLPWPFAHNGEGYGLLAHEGKMCLVSRLVCEERHCPPPTPKHEAAHSCGKGEHGCTTQAHLSWKTHRENEADKLLHGTSNRGERNGLAKLDADAVLAIRADKRPQRLIAADFGISQTLVSQIVRSEGWRHLP